MAKITLERIKEILADFRDTDLSTANEDTTFESIGLDSLDVVDLAMKLEEESGVSIPMDGTVTTLGHALAHINK